MIHNFTLYVEAGLCQIQSDNTIYITYIDQYPRFRQITAYGGHDIVGEKARENVIKSLCLIKTV